MLKFIHVTDTHLVEPGRRLYGLAPTQRLERCIDSILAEHADAAMCIITGDLAHEGHPLAYTQLALTLRRLPMPVYPLIGNHDHRSRFTEHFPHTPVDANGFVQYAVDLGAYRGLLMDTNEPGVSYGVLCEQRAQWLAAQLAQDDARPVLLFLHHPPFAVGIPAMDQISLIDTTALRSVIDAHRARIRHIFFGHLHRPIYGSWQGIPFSTLRGTNHQVALNLHEPNNVQGNQEPPQYGVVLLSEEMVTVHLHDFDDSSPHFWL